MKTFKVFVPVFIFLVIAAAFIAPDITSAESISDKVLRLHILANSDSSEDQHIKLGLKNYFLENSKELFCGKTIEANIAIAQNNKAQMENICNEYLKDYGKTAFVTVEKEFFRTRVYDDFTLPSGVYNSIKITIGEGKGHNWWCIVFPSVCLNSCSEAMSEYLTDDEMELVTSGYTPKFKIIEIYEKIKDRLN